MEERIRKALAKARGPEEKVKAVYFAFVDHCLENREYFRITQYFLTEDARENTSKELIEAINIDSMRLLEYGIKAMQEGIEEGVFRDDLNPVAASLVAWRNATGILDLAVLGDEAYAATGDFGELFDLAFALLIRGIKR